METALKLWKKVGMWFVLLVLLIVFTSISPAFRTIGNFGNILKQISILGQVASGGCAAAVGYYRGYVGGGRLQYH